MIVMKFGGTSVADAAAVRRLGDLVAARREEQPLVVVSALAGVTDALVAATNAKAAEERTQATARLAARHEALMTEVAGAEQVAALRPWLEALRVRLTSPGDAAAAAEVLALGEILSSTIVAAALAARGLASRWFDARHVIRTAGEDPQRDPPDLEATQRLIATHLAREAAGDAVVVTQGFIASDPAGRTTLLGRGGSDYTAALLGQGLGAARIEIWTDVDGVLTAPPQLVPAARRVKVLSFTEAAELAYFGAKVLHPATIRPALDAGIPVHVLNARRSAADEPRGTIIVPAAPVARDPRWVAKSVAVKRGITVITINSTRMLGAVGFLARIFAIFERARTAVDLVTTSEVSVSLTVDDTRALAPILEELKTFAQAEVEHGRAIVCVVGEGLRNTPGIAARVLRAVVPTNVRMISQGASEINVSLVIAGDEADGVVRRLHDELFQGRLPRDTFGERFDELEHGGPLPAPRRAEAARLAPMAEDLARRHGTPLYVYDLDRVEAQIMRVTAAVPHPRFRLLYSMKANFNPAILRMMARHGVGVDAVSPMEARRAVEHGVPADAVLFTANNVATDALVAIHDLGVRVNLGALSDVRRFAAARPGASVMLRLNPGVGAGHHAHVVTGGTESKFGLGEEDLGRARNELTAAGVHVVGLHSHIGSGILEPAPFLEAAEVVMRVAQTLPDLEVVDLGGGIGVPYRPGEDEMDLPALGAGLTAAMHRLEERLGRPLALWLEPGRFLVAQAGTLLARVTCRKEMNERVYVGLDTGLNHLIRPAFYGSYHAISNLSAPEGPVEAVEVVGNICESSDVFAAGRPLPSPQESHLLAIHDAGAYGFAMASHYNLWPLPREVLLRGDREVSE
jgi:diaminopimelate decarboxylase/aspartate kinase